MSRHNVSSRTILMAPQAQRPDVPRIVDEKYGEADDIVELPQEKLIAILTDANASVYAKAKACQGLAVVGDRAAVPALAALLADPQLAHYARYGLEPMPDPAVDEALRAAMGKVKGKLLIGVINSIGQRRDKKSLEALAKLLHEDDPDVARAASDALARIRPQL